jgi:signal transduction histidine kinase
VIYVFLIYGLAFVALGLILALEARLPVVVVPRRVLVLLAGFGLTHGLHEWVEMAFLVRPATPHPALAVLGPLALALSFTFLLQVGVETLVRRRWAWWLPAALYVAWVYLFVLSAPPAGAHLLPWAELIARLVLGFSGSLLAGVAMLTIASRWHGAERSSLRATGLAFITYAIVAGLLVTPEPLEPFSPFDSWQFGPFMILPVAIRALCAIAIGIFLSRALVVEAGKLRSDLARQRLHQEVVSMIAHDLRSSVMTIDLGVSIIERLAPEDHGGERERRATASLRHAAANLDVIVHDLLDASLLESRRLPLRREQHDLVALVDQVIGRATPETGGHAVRLRVVSPPPPLAVDPHRLEQILTNLLSNAAKYSYPQTEIVVEVQRRPREALVAVTNRGPGIAAADMPQLFTRFYRGRTGTKQPGLGLGLYIVEGLVAAHGGRVWAESEPGRYARFCFTLPLSPAEGIPPAPPAHQ